SSTVRDCRGCGCGRCTGVGVRSKAEVAIELEALACSLEEQRREKKAIRSERFVVKARLLACSLTVRDAAKPSSRPPSAAWTRRFLGHLLSLIRLVAFLQHEGRRLPGRIELDGSFAALLECSRDVRPFGFFAGNFESAEAARLDHRFSG